ncbi:hypothetical protein COY89_03010 [Candidatus Roizmanbacteria bacterium CG_4_10_14_0_8_um_filter_36_36]|uniref:Glycoside hydrolase family 5 domain-containing protein n=1 Tax=Candidatus Roizmanbacteria bacterium CG10_big_fil_rev_8_21_14_0_10_36_26 TaxID=1974851 RepID=A0A2M8KKJ8_9BACT|nr:MAG: hypothetical protein COS51_00890 [Candidatus Roizmanbacteria bacterium CG03_land_8_20_14_0_80_36_21]PIY70057.1 MAG: hypothetical protein COY89_03010 [Candidatus Roizmanbacteria bacterium CG_4_10_14_0_8_um_filter_36_36]PJE60420.1 MAG: hypothetical protein COU86_04505 [Candidatus Roizmanbacteria bacterium CG10_big_fil_rev_8_21_14_0_10_36_26]
MKKLVILITTFLLLVRPSLASGLNNKFGIHLAQPHAEDLQSAARLVNSTGGDWGYVTLVIQENDRKKDKWQAVFDQLRQLHLIPIIRLATQADGDNWERPKKEGADDWVNFLDSLNWVVKNRYVILFNEPNHGSEWGGEVDAEDYAKVVLSFAKKLKEKNPDFFVMLAGLDASAPQGPPAYEDEEVFFKKMLIDSVSDSLPSVLAPSGRLEKSLRAVGNPSSSTPINIFNYVDGWASHSYPNPDFSGSPWDSGRGTIRTYQWELGLLKSLGVEKELPVFITETGWERQVQSSKFKVQSYLDENTVADYFRIVFENVWLPDERVVAVTPFIFNYQGQPFLDFSWQKLQSSDFYQQYYTVQSLEKIHGEPEQIEKGGINFSLPMNLVAQSNYQFDIKLKNDGQAIWDKDNSYSLTIVSDSEGKLEYLIDDLKDIRPFEEKELRFNFKTGKENKNNSLRFVLNKNGKKVLESNDWKFQILPLPNLKFELNLFPKLNDQGKDFEIQIFDKKENLIFQKKNLPAFAGQGSLDNIQNIVLGERYRVVVLKPYYLPRQNFIVFNQQENKIKFKPLAPLDFSLDGRLSSQDLISLIKHPFLFKLFFP